MITDIPNLSGFQKDDLVGLPYRRETMCDDNNQLALRRLARTRPSGNALTNASAPALSRACRMADSSASGFASSRFSRTDVDNSMCS